MKEILDALTAEEAWGRLQAHNEAYYRMYAAVYSGDPVSMRRTARPKSFWRRPGKQKIHVPIAADIAATSSDLLFGEEMQISAHDEKEEPLDECQLRLEQITQKNSFHALLCEAAESCSVLGDVYFKAFWDKENRSCPMIRVIQGDSAWPEYRLGYLHAIHIFTSLKTETGSMNKTVSYRTHELYEHGRITTKLFRGSEEDLGQECSAADLKQFGLSPVTEVPDDAMLAIHIPNIRPNRMFRGSYMGRSDFDNQRDLMDALDEAYSSWVRDIRLGKARLIVPAEYLRRSPDELFGDGTRSIPTFDFDEDVETLTALDTTASNGGVGILPTQPAIRAVEHGQTCTDLIEKIVSGAGYAPQTFGINIEGMAESGTALRIREKKSYSTTAKKQAYWQDALEEFLTSIIHLDAKLYPGRGSTEKAHIHVRFSDVIAGDLPNIAESMQLLTSAIAASTETKVRMLHPDWTSDQISAEVKTIREEYGLEKGAVELEGAKLQVDAQKMQMEALKAGGLQENGKPQRDAGGEEHA